MESVSGASIWISATCVRFQAGSRSPLAKRIASRFCTARLPRKWSMRNTRSEENARATAACSDRAERTSSPKGFSRITFASSASPVAAKSSMTASAPSGGTDR